MELKKYSDILKDRNDSKSELYTDFIRIFLPY